MRLLTGAVLALLCAWCVNEWIRDAPPEEWARLEVE